MQINRTNTAAARPVSTKPAKVQDDDSKKEEKGVVDEYVSSVRHNFRENGAVQVIFTAGVEGWLGGYMGQMAGNMVSGFFPGALGAAISQYSGAAGATLGFIDGLHRDW